MPDDLPDAQSRVPAGPRCQRAGLHCLPGRCIGPDRATRSADRPSLATALALDRPFWTADNDFFFAGVPTWTSDRVEL
ncbi:PIN domain-containing protein [Nocardioides sp. DS6]|uniref:PIN domain-containing protein n=1 Tax=Nocardioides eburneus TaxID=3231482 RepID=A0ABV3T1B4_9ACTN